MRVPADRGTRAPLREHPRAPVARAALRGGRLLHHRVERGVHARRHGPAVALARPQARRGQGHRNGRTSSWAPTSRSAGRSSAATGTWNRSTYRSSPAATSWARPRPPPCAMRTPSVASSSSWGRPWTDRMSRSLHAWPPHSTRSPPPKTAPTCRSTSTNASGGFVAPFLQPDTEWDFRLPLVVSINVSGHKYGLVYPGVGWIIWRDEEHLPEDLIFKVNYLGGEMPTFALNFSRPGAQVAAAVLQLPAPRPRRVPARPAELPGHRASPVRRDRQARPVRAAVRRLRPARLRVQAA